MLPGSNPQGEGESVSNTELASLTRELELLKGLLEQTQGPRTRQVLQERAWHLLRQAFKPK